MKRAVAVLFLTLTFTVNVFSQEKTDTLSNKDTRNVMLNAEAASVPREINIGLPSSGTGAIVMLDGLKHAWGLPRGQYHFCGGNAYEPAATISLMDAVIQTGEFGVLVDSRTRFGTDVLQGAVTAATSSNGLLRFDGAINGPVSRAKGWYFAVGAYINYDPTSVNAPGRTFVDKKQIYNLALTKRWKGAELTFQYRFSLCDDSVDQSYNIAPFVYNGNGTVSPVGAFRIGRDCYFPADDHFTYMDLRTGGMRSGNLGSTDRRYLHDAFVLSKFDLPLGWKMEASAHICALPGGHFTKMGVSGIDLVTEGSGVTYSNGLPYTGAMQNRFVMYDNMDTVDGELLVKASKKFRKHSLKMGMSAMFTNQYEAISTFNFGHTVSANPERLYRNGAETWAINRSAQFFTGLRYGVALYAVDNWNITDRLLLRLGARIKPGHLDVKAATTTKEDSYNVRVEGFNLADPSLAKLRDIALTNFDYAGSAHISYRIVDRLFAYAEGFYSMTGKSSTYFKNASIPSLKPIGNALGSGGLMYDNNFMNLTAVLTYITSWNNAKVMTVAKQIGGQSEVIPWTAQYGIGTLGVTVDGNFHIGGFNLHALVTWQDPRYKNYRNEFVFSDGSTQIIDYTGKVVTGISKTRVEFDPSYKWKDFRVWASVRYFSRQYASRTNYAYFNGHFETFAGADLTLGRSSKVSVNFINPLFQNGAKGSVDIADTIEDPADLEGYLIGGTYIRPFTVEMSYTYKF